MALAGIARATATNRADLDGIGRGLLAQELRTRGRRNDQRRHLAGCEHRQAKIDIAAAADDHVQRRPAFAKRFAQPPVFIRELGKNGFGRPDVPTVGAQRAGADDHHVGNGAQQAHHHAILGAESADVAAAGVSLHIERDDAVQRSHKIAEDIGMRARRRHAQASVQARQLRRQRQHVAALRFEERLSEARVAGPGRGIVSVAMHFRLLAFGNAIRHFDLWQDAETTARHSHENKSTGRQAGPAGDAGRRAQLVTAYYTEVPDPSVPAQRVAFGTSGHRGSAFQKSFNEWHVLAISQAICEYRKAAGIDGPLFLGIDTHAFSVPARASALEVLAANGVDVMLAQQRRIHADAGDVARDPHLQPRAHAGLADGIVVTPSHNPPDNGGFKYNPPNGGPADEDVTRWIEATANGILERELKGVRRIPSEGAARAHDASP